MRGASKVKIGDIVEVDLGHGDNYHAKVRDDLQEHRLFGKGWPVQPFEGWARMRTFAPVNKVCAHYPKRVSSVTRPARKVPAK